MNAVLRPEVPIQSVEILNPFNEKEFSGDKLSVLDIKARDQQGQIINIEMQLLLPQDFKGRILYYWADMFRGQLGEGDGYAKLRPAISICLVNQTLFRDVDDYHLAFELVDAAHNQRFSELMQIHVLQLPKLERQLAELRDDLETWIYFFRNVESMDVERLPPPLDQPVYVRAVKELEMLTKDEQERERYEARLKAIRDQQSLLEDALEQGLEQGIEQGLEQGIEQGLEKGEHIGRIHLSERLLKRPLTPSDDLLQLSLEDLRRRAEELETELISE